MVEELVKLRVSVARLGQLLGLSGEELDIKDKSYGELCVIAAAHSRGWNQLAMRVAEQIEALIKIDAYSTKEINDLTSQVRFLKDALSKIQTIAEIAQ